jgi:hypothetical protein
MVTNPRVTNAVLWGFEVSRTAVPAARGLRVGVWRAAATGTAVLWLLLMSIQVVWWRLRRDCSDPDRAEPRWGRTIDRAGFDGRRRRANPS